MAAEGVGQQLAFAGVTFCTKDMRLSMSKEQALSAERLVDLMLAGIGRAWRDEELWKELHSLVGAPSGSRKFWCREAQGSGDCGGWSPSKAIRLPPQFNSLSRS